MQPARLDLSITHGSPWRKSFKLMQPDYAYKPITSINKTAPLTITVNHDLPQDEWPVWLEGTTSGTLNSDKARQPFRMARALDHETIEFNGINGAGVTATGGFLVYQKPIDLSGCTAEMQIGDTAATLTLSDGEIIAELTAEQVAELGAGASYQLLITHADGTPIKYLCGEVSTHDCKNSCAHQPNRCS